MTKVTIANYLIDNLANRFPMGKAGILLDHDIIDVVVDGWECNCYPTIGFDTVDKKKTSPHKRILM